MFITEPLPPLKANSQRIPDSYLAVNIRSEMSKIQHSLQRSNQLYIDYFSDIPFGISETLKAVQESHNSISKEIQKNKLEEFKTKIQKYNSTIDSLSAALRNHIDTSKINGQTNFFAEIFPSFERTLISENQAILENLEKKLSKKVDEYEKEMDSQSDTSQYTFKLPFSDSSSNQPKQIEEKNTTESFSTLDTVLDLEKHNLRIQSLESQVEVSLNFLKDLQIAIKKDTSRQTALSVTENHEKIQKLLIKSRLISQRIEHPPPLLPDVEPPIIMKKKSNIEQYEFDQFSRDVNDVNEKILAEIESFEILSEQKISGFNQNVDIVEQKVADFENSVAQLNELVADVSQKIVNAEDNYDELERKKKPPQINGSHFAEKIKDFKSKIAVIQNEARNEIAKLKSEIKILEKKYSL